MSGVLYIEAASVEATSGQMLVTFTSGGEDFRFHLPAHVALKFRQKIMTNGWQVCCSPDAEVVPIRPTHRKGGRL
jgi:hypothetical protein